MFWTERKLIMSIFSFIKSNISIETVIGEYVTLKRFGHYLKGPCPLHQEKTASFTVSPHKEIFYCFGCHAGGDVIKFIESVEQCSALEAAYHLADRYNITIPEELSRKTEQRTSTQEKKGYFELCKKVALWCHSHLKNSPNALKYVTSRGINTESIDHFMIGYFPGGTRAIKDLTSYIQNSSFLLEDLLNNSIIMSGKGNILYSPFEERIIFPIKDLLGNYCGFGGRIFNPQDERPKYYNSHENEFFAKGSLLYGLDTAKKEIQKKGFTLLVEGYTDCIALAQHGYPNTVATLGTACTPDHLNIIARYAQELYLMYDGDIAGQKAIMRLTELSWNVNLDLKIISLPLSEDPASFCAKSGDLTPIVNQAHDIFTYFIETMGVQFAAQTLNEKMQLSKRILELIMHISQPLKKELLITQASSVLGIPVNLIKKEILQLERTKKRELIPTKTGRIAAEDSMNTSIKTKVLAEQDLLNTLPKTELSLCVLALTHIDLIETTELQWALDYFQEPLKNILIQLNKMYIANKTISFMQFFDTLSTTDQQIVNRIVIKEEHEVNRSMFDYVMQQFYKKHWQTVAHDVKEKLKIAQQNNNFEEIQNILSSFQLMKKKLRDRNIL